MNSSVPAAFLILALLEEESLASASLRRLELDLNWLRSGGLGPEASAAVRDWEESEASDRIVQNNSGNRNSGEQYSADRRRQLAEIRMELPPAFNAALDRALAVARRSGDLEHVSSSHLLLATIELCAVAQEAILARGVDLLRLRRELGIDQNEPVERLTVDFELERCQHEENMSEQLFANTTQTSLAPQKPEDQVPQRPIARVLDAALNRCREGIRVLEDHARFVQNHAELCRQLKQLRHDLVAAEKRHLSIPLTGGSPSSRSLDPTAARDVGGDMGTQITLDGERQRSSIDDLVTANFRRVQEAFRSLEEFGKLLSPEFGAEMKQLRYRAYDLQCLLPSCPQADNSVVGSQVIPQDQPPQRGAARRNRLQQAIVYVLITEDQCLRPWQEVAEQALEGGADVLQLREKKLEDHVLLQRARILAEMCRRYGALCIINDRPDIALLSAADGVHVGQEEIPLEDVRKLVGPEMLIGVSTHNIDQAQRAEQGGADYLGVGPTFPSRTKQFEDFPGLAFVRNAVENIRIPWFAIGGIGASEAELLSRAGCQRIAVSSAVIQAKSPDSAVRELRSPLRTT